MQSHSCTEVKQNLEKVGERRGKSTPTHCRRHCQKNKLFQHSTLPPNARWNYLLLRKGGGFGSVGCVCAQEAVLSATGTRLLAASDTAFLTTMLRMNCIHMDVHGHVVSTYTVQEAVFFFCYNQIPVAYYFWLFCIGIQEMTSNAVV